jgi:hypothetical protein
MLLEIRLGWQKGKFTSVFVGDVEAAVPVQDKSFAVHSKFQCPVLSFPRRQIRNVVAVWNDESCIKTV